MKTMVAETKETMTRMFEAFNDNLRAMFDAGRHTQEAWFKGLGEFGKNPTVVETFVARGEKLMKEFTPLVSKNMETFAQSCETGLRTGINAFRAACDITANTN